MSYLSIAEAVHFLLQGKTIAYPTEAVFGLGCLPDNSTALEALLNLKQRDRQKGLILIANSIEPLLPYIDFSSIPPQQWEKIQRSWPGPYTWVFPATHRVLSQVRGQFDSVAVRVTAHPVASALAERLGGPLVSTSANLSFSPPYKKAEEVLLNFAGKIAGVVDGALGLDLQPTTIVDALTGRIYR